MSEHPKTVQIYGMAPSIGTAPPPPPGGEVWLSNWHKGYLQRIPRVIHQNEWTRYFNLHSRKHMDTTYPTGVKWYQEQDGTRPIYFQLHQPDIPGSTIFPREAIQQYFAIDGKPMRFFNFTGAWLIAFAIMEGFERIEMRGFELKSTKPLYYVERPCFFYWIQIARDRGIDIWLEPDLDLTKDTEIGDPTTYEGPLYGYETKPEDFVPKNLGE